MLFTKRECGAQNRADLSDMSHRRMFALNMAKLDQTQPTSRIIMV